MTSNVEIVFNNELEKLLASNAEECECYSLLHRMSYLKYSRYSTMIEVPIIILSNLVGFSTALDLGWDKINILLGLISIIVGIIKSIHSYSQLAQRGEGHKMASQIYHQIRQKIIVELALPRSQRIPASEMLQIIKKDIENIAQVSPFIDDQIIEKFKIKYPENNVKKPNITNGLTPAQIIKEEIIQIQAQQPPQIYNINDLNSGAM